VPPTRTLSLDIITNFALLFFRGEFQQCVSMSVTDSRGGA
jgi:hypothetical protein